MYEVAQLVLDFSDEQLAAIRDVDDPLAACQCCLANPRATTLAVDKSRRCPVCGSDCTGPRRGLEHAVLFEAGLVAVGE